MNERIRELYKETTGKDWVYDFDPDYAEKFAELIVYECIQCIKDTDKNLVYTAQSAGIVIAAQNRSITNIKQHFGVEE